MGPLCQTSRHRGEAGRLPPEPSGAPLCSSAFWCLPESDDVCFVMDKFRSFLCNLILLFSFQE
jgi:hypothetical protein